MYEKVSFLENLLCFFITAMLDSLMTLSSRLFYLESFYFKCNLMNLNNIRIEN
jgi:hypothetical protein